MKISVRWMAEGMALLASGDMNGDVLRARYKKITGNETTLDDRHIVAAAMTGEPDGEDDDGFVKAVQDCQATGLVVEDDAEGSLADDEDFSRASHNSG